MGRGRAKAKQTKVARELKYSSQGTDFNALQRELAGSGSSTDRTGDAESRGRSGGTGPEEIEDDYGDWAAERR